LDRPWNAKEEADKNITPQEKFVFRLAKPRKKKILEGIRRQGKDLAVSQRKEVRQEASVAFSRGHKNEGSAYGQ